MVNLRLGVLSGLFLLGCTRFLSLAPCILALF